MDQAHDSPGANPSIPSPSLTSSPRTPPLAPRSNESTQRRAGWILAATLVAMAVLIVVVLYSIDVL